jgi:L-2-aminoadipate reductase
VKSIFLSESPKALGNSWKMDSALQRWENRLAALTELQLPTDYPRPIPQRTVEAEYTLNISDETSMAILQLAFQSNLKTADDKKEICSPFSIILASFSILLQKYTAEEDITVGSSSLSTNPLILRMKISPLLSFQDVLQVVLDAERDASKDEIPFKSLVEYLASKSSSEEEMPPLFKVRLFNLTDTNADTLSSTTTSSSCDLTMYIHL